MEKTFDNRMNSDFARRLVLSGIISVMISFIAVTVLIIPIVALFGAFGPFVFMALFCLIIGVVADMLRLAPFPFVEILQNDHHVRRRERALEELRHSGYALPLSFAAASLWATLVMDVSDIAIPMIALFCVVPPATVMVLIVSIDCQTPSQALARSAKAFLVVLASMFVVIPGEAPEMIDRGLISEPGPR